MAEYLAMAFTRRPFRILIVFALLLVSACSNTRPTALQPADPSGNAVAAAESETSDAASIPESVAMADESPAELLATDDGPEQTPMAEGSAEATGSLPRTTAEGIALSARTTDFDYGNGPEPSLEVDAKHADGWTGVFLPIDKATADTDGLDVITWAGSGGTYVVLAETGPSVRVVRLVSAAGGVDQTAPNSSRLAVVAVRAGELSDLRVEALDDSGNVIGTCATDDFLLRCS